MIRDKLFIYSIIEKIFIFLIPLSYIVGVAATNYLFGLILIFFFLKNINNIKSIQISSVFENKFFIIISIFIGYIVFNSIINFENVDIKKIFSLIKLLIIPILFYYFFSNTKQKIIYLFFYSSFILCLILSADIIFQYYNNGIDLIGNKPGVCFFDQKINQIVCERLSGFFGKELIAGTYLFFFGISSSVYFYLKKKNFFYILSLLLFIITILLTGDRSPLIFVFLFFLFFIFIFKKLNFKNFSFFLINLIIIFFIVNNNYYLKKRFIFIHDQMQTQKNLFLSFKDTVWGAHFFTAFYIGNEKILFGSGVGSFKKLCKDEKYEKKLIGHAQYRCSSHPHNIFLEIYSELGAIGILLFFIFLYYNFRDFLKNRNNIDLECKILFLLLICFIFPFKPTGSFYSSFYGSIFWLMYALYILRPNK